MGAAHAARWYQVELLVFAREDPAAATAEQWDPLPRLAYPTLRASSWTPPGSPPAAPRTPISAPTPGGRGGRIPAAGRPRCRVRPGPRGTPEPTRHRTPTPYRAAGGPARVQRQRRPDAALRPFQRCLPPGLGTADRQRREEPAHRNRRLGRQRQWPRLQGSIRLYSSRYLYLETDLWLNTDGSYLPGQWRMPPPPLGPPSLLIEAPRPESAPRLRPASRRRPGAAAAGAARHRLTHRGTRDRSCRRGGIHRCPAGRTAGPGHPWRHAVLLQQKRRMRNAEVNYLDHPLFGAVIKVTPLDAGAAGAGSGERVRRRSGPPAGTAACPPPLPRARGQPASPPATGPPRQTRSRVDHHADRGIGQPQFPASDASGIAVMPTTSQPSRAMRRISAAVSRRGPWATIDRRAAQGMPRRLPRQSAPCAARGRRAR